jgi:hypothetical protein
MLRSLGCSTKDQLVKLKLPPSLLVVKRPYASGGHSVEPHSDAKIERKPDDYR